MASQASTLLGALLDRLLPSPRRTAERSGTSYAWAPPSRWSRSWAHADRLRGTPMRPAGGVGGPGPTAEEVRRAAAAGDRVDVTVVGTVPAGSKVVEGELETGPEGDVEGEFTAEFTADPGQPVAAAVDQRAGHRAVGGTGPAAAPRRLRDDVLAGVAIALVALLALGAVVYRGSIGDWLNRQRAEQAVAAFARAWENGRLEKVTYDRASTTGGPAVADAADLSAAVARRAAAVTAGLTTRSADSPSAVSLLGSPVLARDGSDRTATQRARVTWAVDGGRSWTYDTTLTVRERGSRWRLVWTPKTMHPALTATGGLLTERVQSARAAILGARDEPLTSTVTMIRVRYATTALIRPRGDIGKLAELTGLDEQALVRKITAEPRGTTVEVAMLPTGRWRAVGPQLRRIQGVTTTRTLAAMPVAPTYGPARLGEALPASAAVAAASGGRVVAGELAGTSGLQRSFDERLRGTPGQRVVLVPLPDAGLLTPRAVPAGAAAGGPVLAVLARPSPGTPVHLTADARVRAPTAR